MSRIGIRSAHYARELAAKPPTICCVCQQPITITRRQGRTKYCSPACRAKARKASPRLGPPVDSFDAFCRDQQMRWRGKLDGCARRITRARQEQADGGSLECIQSRIGFVREKDSREQALGDR